MSPITFKYYNADGKNGNWENPVAQAITEAPTLMYQGLQVGYGLAITKDCEDPVRAIKFLDYLCSDEGAVLYKWGVEGENYFVDENGMRYRTEEEIAKASSDPDYGKNTRYWQLYGISDLWRRCSG